MVLRGRALALAPVRTTSLIAAGSPQTLPTQRLGIIATETVTTLGLGAALAGVTLWRWYGRPDGPALERKLQQSQAARARAIDDGLIGQSVRTIASSAEQGIKEHEGLHKMAEGLKEGRVFRVEPRAEQAGSAHVR